MDGYSVNEAATVLGIPEGRVWELLARGVLAGSSEVGGDMRVFLRGMAVAEAPHPAAGSTGGHGTNGGSNGESHGEQTPFRELLTEFRNLTERYGQALLALGEARGEVASLRGRVDLLEARIERRAPWVEAPMAGWQPAAPPVAEPSSGTESEAVDDLTDAPTEASAASGEARDEADAAPPGEDLDQPPEEISEVTTGEHVGEARPRRSEPRSRSRSAISGFAEALARAEDPTTAHVGPEEDEDVSETLPGAREAAEALAAYREEVRESGPAEAPVAVAALPAGYSNETPEPDWIAEEDLLIPGEAAAPVTEAPTELAAFSVAAVDVEEPTTEAETAVNASAEPESTPRSSATAPPSGDESATGFEATSRQAATVAVVSPPPEVAAEPEPEAPPEVAAEIEPAVSVADEPDAPPEVAAEIEPVRAPIEIGAEPPAEDDLELLRGTPGFMEPPIVPEEPAFWEPEGRARAPFAVPHLESWEPDELAAVRAEMRRTTVTGPRGEPATSPPAAQAPDSQAAADRPPSVASPAADEPAIPPADPAPAPAGIPPSARRQRTAGERAVRRLRRLLG